MPSSECIKKLLFSCLLATSLSYADDSIDHAKTQSIESIVGTPRYNPSSVSDSVRAVIEHTGKLREAEAMSDIAQDIKRISLQRPSLKRQTQLTSQKTSQCEPSLPTLKKCLGGRGLLHRTSNVN